MKQIIINADDFGRHQLINRAVKIACRKGCLRSTSIMAGGIAFDHAVTIAKSLPELGVGIHLTLSDGNPILPPDEIPSLVTPQGTLHENHAVFLGLCLHRKINFAEVRAELAAQIEKVQRTGLKITHVDSHQHLHHWIQVSNIVLDLAQRAGIDAIRISDAKVFEGNYDAMGQIIGRFGLSTLAKLTARQAHKRNFRTPNHFEGIVAGESITESFMTRIIKHLPEGTTEVMLHPGTANVVLEDFCKWSHDFEGELDAVTSPKVLALLEEKNIAAVNFSALGN